MDSKSASLCTDEHWIYLFIYISFIVNIDKWERKRIQLDMQEDLSKKKNDMQEVH